MKCKCTNDAFGRFALHATPGEYDAFPGIRDVFVDVSPIKLNQFRAPLAACLPFASKINGALETSQPFFPLTASLLRDFVPFDVVPTNIKWEPADIPSGSGTLVVSAGRTSGLIATTLCPDDEDVAELRLVPSDQFHGQLSSIRACITGSNAWLVRHLNGVESYIQSLVAFGIIFAEDFDARRLVIACDSIPSSFDITSLARVTESVGLHLSILEVTNIHA